MTTQRVKNLPLEEMVDEIKRKRKRKKAFTRLSEEVNDLEKSDVEYWKSENDEEMVRFVKNDYRYIRTFLSKCFDEYDYDYIEYFTSLETAVREKIYSLVQDFYYDRL